MKNNFITKIIGATLAFAMMIGGAVGINAAKEAKMVGADGELTLVYTLSGSVSGSGNSYAGPNTSTQGGIGWTVNGNLQQDPWRLGGKNITNTNRAIYSTTALPYNVNKIEITFGTAANITVNSLNVGVYSTANKASTGGTGDVANFTPAFVASDTVTVQKTDDTSWNNCFYNITLNVTNSDSKNNRFVQFVSAKFYEIQNVDPGIEYYDIQFDSQGGSDCESIEHIADGGRVLELPTPTKEKNTSSQTKYTFEGWYTDTSFAEEKRFTTDTEVHSDLTLYANYTETHYNIVRFHTNGGSAVDDQEVNNGSRVSRPDTTKDGCVLDGWFTSESLNEEDRFNFSTVINNQNLDLYAKWASIEIEENGVFVKVTDTQDITNGGKYLITYNNQVAFNGFLNNLDVASNNVPVTFDGDYIVKDTNTCKAYFVINTENNSIRSASGYYIGRTGNSNGINLSTTEAYENNMSIDGDGHFVVATSAGPSLRYNKASGDTRFRYYKTGQENIDLYKFTRTYTVSFETNSESSIDDIAVLAGETLTLPANPTKAADASYSYTFEGWYTDSNLSTPFVQSNPINSDLTLYAKYSQEAISNPRTYLDAVSSTTTLLATENVQTQSGSDSITFSEEGYANQEAISTFNVGAVVATTSIGQGNTAPAYYNTGSAFRLYGKNTLTFTSQTNITEIEFTDVEGNRISNCSASTGTLNGATWTGSATSVTFTNTNTSGHYRISSIEITYGKQNVSVTSAGLRFSASIAKSTWAAIEENWDISEYGFMLFKTDSLDGLSETPVKDRYENSGALAVARSASGAAPTYEEGDNYVFSVKVNVSTYSKYFCAAAYFVIDDVYYFLTEQQKTVKGMAEYHIANGGTTISSAALAILAA